MQQLEQRAKPHMIYVALTDIWSAAGLVFPIIFVVMAVGALVQGDGRLSGWLVVLALGVAIVGVGVARWRVAQIQETVAGG